MIKETWITMLVDCYILYIVIYACISAYYPQNINVIFLSEMPYFPILHKIRE